MPAITIDLNELLGEESPRAAIIHAVASMLYQELESSVRTEIREQVSEQIRQAVAPRVEAVFTTPFQPTDLYGTPRGPVKTMAEVVVETAREHLLEKVNDRGERDVYNSQITRLQWLARQVAKTAVERDLKPQVDAAKAEVTKAIEGRLAEVFATAVTSVLKK